MNTSFQSLLFVPGNRPDRFAKAFASEADCVCIDLEDAIPANAKDDARGAALAAAATAARCLAIRINPVTTRAGLADLLALAAADVRPAVILVPMVEDAAEVAIVRRVLADPQVTLVPLVETVRGLDNAGAIAADPAVGTVMFGGGDFSAEIGVALEWTPLLAARSRLVMACASQGKGVLDVPFIRMDDAEGLARECEMARDLGFTAKAAIHPAQIAAIHAAFRPAPADVEEAEAAVAAYAEAGGGAVRFRGKMLEAPVMARYRQILALKEKTNA
ncbi:CoA ester lyase [Croceicoccus sp. BE223]|uniref:HpcH/HpaI aldolase/citrate lyase family protein n=1 Tax=Croceicoccus sp. BE223 TaxID=2817716 RepID=UPI00285551D8|nr:CoA ester lyase [Croceicoccus sp. BE223]MDR7101180.1 citrate lyase beta subunit [Croceicoccus sp. BE223]